MSEFDAAHRCKKLVNADKTFAVETAPLALTIHLKRFDANGRKITDTVRYPAHLDLSPAMCDTTQVRSSLAASRAALCSPRAQAPQYSLYGVVCHAGSGPHSGHYYAYVRAGDGRWYRMDDDEVQGASEGTATSQRSAYMLFYIQTNEHATSLDAAIATATSSAPLPARPPLQPRTNGIASLPSSKRKADTTDDADDIGEPAAKRPVYGPLREAMPPAPTSTSSAHAGGSSSPNVQRQPMQNRYAPLAPPSTSSDAAAPVHTFYGNTAAKSSMPAHAKHAFRQPGPSSSSSTGGGGGGARFLHHQGGGRGGYATNAGHKPGHSAGMTGSWQHVRGRTQGMKGKR